MSQKIHIFSCITVIAKYLTQTFILTCCQLTLIYCPYLCFALCLPSNQWFWNLYCTNKNMIAEYIVLSNIISVVSNNILRICIQEPLLILKKLFLFILCHHVTACSFAIKFPRLITGNYCTQTEVMIKPIKTFVLIQHHVEIILWKNKLVIPNHQALLLGKNYS